MSLRRQAAHLRYRAHCAFWSWFNPLQNRFRRPKEIGPISADTARLAAAACYHLERHDVDAYRALMGGATDQEYVDAQTWVSLHRNELVGRSEEELLALLQTMAETG